METNKIIEILSPLLILKYIPNDENFMLKYVEILKDLQLDILQKAVDEILRTEEEFPRPAKIIKVYFDIIQREGYRKCGKCKVYHPANHTHSKAVELLAELQKNLFYRSYYRVKTIDENLKKCIENIKSINDDFFTASMVNLITSYECDDLLEQK